MDGEQVRKAAKDFAEREVAPHAAEWDERGICPIDVLKKMGKLGFLGTIVDRGSGYGYTARAIILEEVARYSAGLAMAAMTHSLVIEAILRSGSEEQKEILPELAAGEYIGALATTEPSGGSDFAGQQTMAEIRDGRWVINGRKCFVTNFDIADICIVTARSAADKDEISAFIIRKGGFEVGSKDSKLGLRSSSTGEILLNSVDDGALLGERGEGRKITLKAIAEVGRSGSAAIALGIIRGCLEDGVRFARDRIVYGKPLTDIQAIQFFIAESRLDYETAKLMVYRAAALKDESKRCEVESSMAKLYSTEAAIRVAERTIRIMGGYGLMNQYPAGRYLRDAVATISASGTSEIMKIVIAGDTIRNM